MPNALSLYIPAPPTEDRDIALGQFMHTWSKLEFKLLLLFHTLTDITLEIANIIFATGFQCSSLIDMFLALGKLRLLDSECAQLKSLCRRYSRANAKRNKIVHGSWEREYDSLNPNKNQWIRIYFTSDPDFDEQIKHNQQIRSTHRYTIQQLISTTEQLKSLVDDFGQFDGLIMRRLDPLLHTEEP